MITDDGLQRVALTRRLVLWQRARGHRSATDDIVCAYVGHAVRPRARTALDLGAGQGSVTLMLAGANPDCVLTAIEAQDISYRLLERNIAANADRGVGARIIPVHGDLRTVDLGERRFDLVTGCPPYVQPGRGTMPRDEQRAAARFELRGGIEVYCAAAARWLAPEGRAVLLMNGTQDDRIRSAASNAGLHPETRWLVLPHPGAVPRFVVYALAAMSLDQPVVERTLTIRDDHGAWTAEFTKARRVLDLPGAAGDGTADV
jgi:tRNA1Val (adenine37-N6)-methyltransferase